MSRPVWKKPSWSSLTDAEYFVAETIEMGLRFESTRAADTRTAQSMYEVRAPLWWDQEGSEQYDAAMKDCVDAARRYRNRGCPRKWKQMGSFWYWVATRQQYEDS